MSAPSEASRKANVELRRHSGALGTLVVLLVVAVIALAAPGWGVWSGLETGGGAQVTYKVASDGDAQKAASTITDRAARMGLVGARAVASQDGSTVQVQVPGTADASEVARLVARTGKLELVRSDHIADADALAQLQAGTRDVALKDGSYDAFLTRDHITGASVADSGSDTTGWVVNVTFDDEGAKAFADATRELASAHGMIAIVLDGTVLSAPSVSQEISGGQVSLTGKFSQQQAEALKATLDTSELAGSLTEDGSGTLAPTGMAWVALPAAAAVVAMVALFARYRRLALASAAGIACAGVIALGVLALLSYLGTYRMTLPALIVLAVCAIASGLSSALVLERFRTDASHGMEVRMAALTSATKGVMQVAKIEGVLIVVTGILAIALAGEPRCALLTACVALAADLAVTFLLRGPMLRVAAHGPIEAEPERWGMQGFLALVEDEDDAEDEDASDDGSETPAE